MSFSRRFLLLSGLSAPAGVASAQTPPLQWVSSEIPPFVWRGAEGPQGYAYELLRRVMKRAGLEMELQFYPWARALLLLNSGQAHASLVAARTPAREERFAWLFPVGYVRFAVFTRKGGLPPSADAAALQGWRVAVLRGSVSRELLDGVAVASLAESRDYADLIALLQRDVVDAILAPEAVVRAQLGRLQLPADSVQMALLEHRLDLYAVAHPRMSRALQQRISSAYQQLVDDGSVAQLRRRHAAAFGED